MSSRPAAPGSEPIVVAAPRPAVAVRGRELRVADRVPPDPPPLEPHGPPDEQPEPDQQPEPEPRPQQEPVPA